MNERTSAALKRGVCGRRACDPRRHVLLGHGQCAHLLSTIARVPSIMKSHQFISRSIHVLLLASAALVAGACTDGGNSDDQREPPSTPEDDVAYIDELVPHHAGALDMANEVLARGADPDVRAMATMMRAAQQQEIDLMLSKRESITGRQTMPTMDDPHMHADMAELSELSGVALDRAFLRHMIPHHAGAVVTSHRALPNLTDAELRELAQMTIEMQTREAAEMLTKLEALGN
jgi:uncharacterized protein (DUF305 family)